MRGWRPGAGSARRSRSWTEGGKSCSVGFESQCARVKEVKAVKEVRTGEGGGVAEAARLDWAVRHLERDLRHDSRSSDDGVATDGHSVASLRSARCLWGCCFRI